MIALAIVLAVLLLLALLPLGLLFSYDGQTTALCVQAGPFRLRILPPKPKKPGKKPKKKKKAKKQEAPKKQAEQKPKKRVDFAVLRSLIGPFFELVRDFLGSFRRHLAIRKLKLHVTFGADDPAESAIRCGQAWAAIGAATPVLQNTLRIKKQDIRAYFDGCASGFSVEAEVHVTIFLFELLGMGVKYGVRALKLMLPLLKGATHKKGQTKNHKKESGAEK